MYLTCALLTNAKTCLYGNVTSQFFQLNPPILEEYLINSCKYTFLSVKKIINIKIFQCIHSIYCTWLFVNFFQKRCKQRCLLLHLLLLHLKLLLHLLLLNLHLHLHVLHDKIKLFSRVFRSLFSRVFRSSALFSVLILLFLV